MREGWREVELGKVCDFNLRNLNKDFPHSKICYLDISSVGTGEAKFNNIIDINSAPSRAKRVPLKGDTIIATVRPGNRSFYYMNQFPLNTIVSTGFSILSPDKNEIDSRFLYYVISNQEFTKYLVSVEKGANYPAVTATDISDAKVILPPLPIQKKIASILSAYDYLIENNLKRIKLLEEKAQLTYEEWFVKMRFPGYESASFDEVTGLPEGWEKKTIGEVCKVSGGGTPSRAKEEYWLNGNITWYSPTDLSKVNSLCIIDSSQKITELGLNKSSAKLLDQKSFMMTSRATIGLFALVDKQFSTNQGFINVTPIFEFEKEYLLYNFKYRVEEFKGHSTGATFPELSKGKFNALEIIWPIENLLKKFNNVASVIHDQLFNLTKQNRLLKEARDILLPRLMSGMINVEELKTESLKS